MSESKAIVSKLLQIKAIQLNFEEPFVWASGIESPIYCDNRVIWSYPGIRSLVTKELIGLLETPLSVNSVVGVATAGIAPAAFLSRELSLPLAYVRSKKKGHGLENLIEGRLHGNERVVVVEDLISTGGSALKAVETLRNFGVEIEGVISVFSYNLSLAQSNFDKAGVRYKSIANLNDLISLGLESGFITNKNQKKIASWLSKIDN